MMCELKKVNSLTIPDKHMLVTKNSAFMPPPILELISFFLTLFYLFFAPKRCWQLGLTNHHRLGLKSDKLKDSELSS